MAMKDRFIEILWNIEMFPFIFFANVIEINELPAGLEPATVDYDSTVLPLKL